jgi:hypothetical protein
LHSWPHRTQASAGILGDQNGDGKIRQTNGCSLIVSSMSAS